MSNGQLQPTTDKARLLTFTQNPDLSNFLHLRKRNSILTIAHLNSALSLTPTFNSHPHFQIYQEMSSLSQKTQTQLFLPQPLNPYCNYLDPNHHHLLLEDNSGPLTSLPASTPSPLGYSLHNSSSAF